MAVENCKDCGAHASEWHKDSCPRYARSIGGDSPGIAGCTGCNRGPGDNVIRCQGNRNCQKLVIGDGFAPPSAEMQSLEPGDEFYSGAIRIDRTNITSSVAMPLDELGPVQRERAKPRDAAQSLEDAAAVFRQRNALYGNNYHEHGKLMVALFPNGITLRTVEEFNRFGVFVQIASKASRYAANLQAGGHPDSALDLATYAAMLHEITTKENSQ